MNELYSSYTTFESVNDECLFEILSCLTLKQKVGVQRVNSRFLKVGEDLMRFYQKEICVINDAQKGSLNQDLVLLSKFDQSNTFASKFAAVKSFVFDGNNLLLNASSLLNVVIKFTTLESLEVKKAKLFSRDKQAWKDLNKIATNLKVVKFREMRGNVGVLSRFFDNSQSLEEVEIHSIQEPFIWPTGFRQLYTCLSSLTLETLKSISLDIYNLNQAIEILEKFENLERIRLRKIPDIEYEDCEDITITFEVLEKFRVFKNLKVLEFKDEEFMGRISAVCLEPNFILPKITKLVFEGFHFSPQAIHEVFVLVPNLKHFHLSDFHAIDCVCKSQQVQKYASAICDNCVHQFVAEVIKLKHLKTLLIYSDRITESLVTYLATALLNRKLQQLRYLDFSWPPQNIACNWHQLWKLGRQLLETFSQMARSQPRDTFRFALPNYYQRRIRKDRKLMLARNLLFRPGFIY